MDRVLAGGATYPLRFAHVEFMAAIPTKLFRIGEVIAHSGLSRQTLHNYTMLGLIDCAERTPAGHRLYGESVFERLERIKQLRNEHTLLEVKRILRESSAPGDATHPPHRPTGARAPKS